MSNLRGIALMVFAMALFATGDAGIKHLSGHLPLSLITAIMGGAGTLILIAVTLGRGEPLWTPLLLHPALAVRFTADLVAALAMSFSLKLVSLSLLSAVMQATPLVVTLGAVLWFREVVGWRRWSAILVGFAGVLILLRPGGAAFEPAHVLPIIAMAALAIRDLATRAAPAGLSASTLSTVGFFSFVPAAAIILALEPFDVLAAGAWPGGADWAFLALIVVTAVGGYFALTAAMRMGEVSAVAPFRYARLIFGMGLGIVIFGERPDLWVHVGAVIVVGSGLYTFLREARLARATRAARALTAAPPPA